MKFLISIVGPTAIGKTDLSIFLAKHLKTEIISSDSRQCYKELKIGTNTPSDTYLKLIPHHCIGHITIKNLYSAGDFEKDAIKIINKLFIKQDIIIMVGGSPLYEQAVIQGFDIMPKIPLNIRNYWNYILKNQGLLVLQKLLQYKDPIYYNKIDISNPNRLIRALSIIDFTGKPFSSFHKKKMKKRNFINIRIGLNIERNDLYQKINKRTDLMFKIGFLEEAYQYYHYRFLNALQTVGYKELFNFFDGKMSLLDSINDIKKHTRHYAKRQITWYKRDSNIFWFNPDHQKKILNFLQKKISQLTS